VLVLVSAISLGCAKQPQPSPDECKAAIVHMIEVQLDSPDYQKMMEQATAAGPGGQRLSAEQVQESAQWLKSQAPTLVTPQFVSQCVERMKRSDIQCTMSATTTNELVEKCHWKVVAGPKGVALGF
jgi:2-keto-3-deoxy-6-phosphogluconate aldolase